MMMMVYRCSTDALQIAALLCLSCPCCLLSSSIDELVCSGRVYYRTVNSACDGGRERKEQSVMEGREEASKRDLEMSVAVMNVVYAFPSALTSNLVDYCPHQKPVADFEIER